MRNQKTSEDIQSAMVEEVLENNLPDHVASLAQARKENAAEIAKLKAVLAELEEQFTKGKQDSEQLTVDANTLISKICALEEEGSKTALHVAELEKEISRTIEESENLKCKIRLMEEECQLSQKLFSEYKKKMDAYKSVVQEIEKNSLTMRELEKITKETEILKSKNAHMKTQFERMIEQVHSEGKTVDENRREIMSLEQDVDNEKSMLSAVKVKLEECQQKRLEMETANIILKKKNSALLTRLQRQVSEQKEKHEQISNHIKYLLDKIEITKTKLENIEHTSN